MNYKKNLPFIISPCSKNNVGGIGSWTRNMYAYSEKLQSGDLYYIHHYANNLKEVTNINTFSRVFTGILIYLKLSFNVGLILWRYRPSVLHVTSSASLGLIRDILIIWLAKLNNTPVIIHWHFGRIPDLAMVGNWEWKLLKYAIQNSSSSIVIDKKSHNTLLGHGFTNIANVPNPIAIDIEQRAKNQIDNKSERSRGRVLFVGHVIRNKGVFELVEACIAIPTIEELVIIGPYDEEIKEELIALSKKRDVGKWLKMLGQQNKDQVLNYMENSQILILPSYTEGFPNVIIEAMAMGCPVVATNVGAIPEMLNTNGDSPSGMCVPIKDIYALKSSIEKLLSNNELAIEYRQNGLNRVLNNFTLEKIITDYQNIWNVVKEKNKKNSSNNIKKKSEKYCNYFGCISTGTNSFRKNII